ncbi:MAG: SDR family oxidoreductase [Actinobacteria bacterium]|nr:SDR family oxidoreductase [Actinomycetota bacterium]
MKTALITGGGGAIAEQIALRLEARGYRLVLADVSRARMQSVAAKLQEEPTLVHCDLSTIDGSRTFADLVEGEYPDLDLLVNNAGYIEPGDLSDLSADDVDRHILINLVAPMQITRAAVKNMRARGSGDVLAIVSMGGIIALRGSAAYSASKFGLRGFHTSIQQELAGSGVRVMGVFPSGVDTPMLRKEAVHASGSPLNFVGTVLAPEQIGEACMSALDTGKLETYVPYVDSLTTRLLGAFPWLIRRVEPPFAKIGEKGRRKYLARIGSGAS